MKLTPDLLLNAYADGVFPMADPNGDIYWYAPDPRAIIPLDDRFHIPNNLRKVIRKEIFEVTVDQSFEDVMRACAALTPGREETWISEEIIDVYCELHRLGHARSLECRIDDALVGGLYGVAIGGAFFGESMFSQVTDASKVALVALVERLRAGGFVLLDTQYMTDHLARFGAYEVPRHVYMRELGRALRIYATW